MLLEIFGFLRMSFTDILDILMVAAIIFLVFKWIKGRTAMSIFIALIIIAIITVVVNALGMKLMSALMGTFIDIGVLALIIIFQPEIRIFLTKFGSRYGMRRNSIFKRMFGMEEENMDSQTVEEMAEACRSMSETKTGALIVLPHTVSLDDIAATGDIVDATVNRRLIMNLFFKNSPLHDGAMIISGDRIVAARCTLPITDRTDIPASFGMRHKAAIGISEESDADVIVVSEETGGVSFVREGELHHISNINELKLMLRASFGDSGKEEKE